MSVTSRPTFLRTTIGRTAVAGAATLVSVMGVAPAALADDGDLAPETQEVDPPADQQEPPGQDEPPADETPTEDGSGDDEVDPPADDPEQGPSDEEETDQGDDESGDDTADAAAVPTGTADEATTEENTSVDIDVLANDTSTDRVTGLQVVDGPGDGEAVVIGEAEAPPALGGEVLSLAVPGAGTLKIRYTPDEDFVGEDTFTYSYTTAEGTSEAVTVSVDVTEAEPVVPVFGEQKYSIGVQIEDGSYVEEGATTAGSTFTITTTEADGTTTTATCTTEAIILGATSICFDDETDVPFFFAPPGASVSITQTAAGPGLTPAAEPRTLGPCEVEPGSESNDCVDQFVLFENTGPLPEPEDDRATTDVDTPVSIDVLDNDTSNDPATELTLASEPGDGQAEITGEGVPAPEPQPGDVGIQAVPAAGSQRVLYTPDEGFTGTDRFTYRLENSNGARTAEVVVRVVDGSVQDSSSDTDPTSGSAALPDTGGADVRLLGVGALLTAFGALLVRGRRRTGDVTVG